MDSASVLFFTSFLPITLQEKKARITIFGMWVTSRWIMDRLKPLRSQEKRHLSPCLPEHVARAIL